MVFEMFSGLRARLLLLVLIAVIPAYGLIFYTAAEQRRQATQEVEAEVVLLARRIAIDQERLINETRQLLLTLSHLSEVQAYDLVACSEFFSRLLTQYPQYANLGVVSTDGRVFCSGRLIGLSADLSDQPFLEQAVVSGAFTIGDYQPDPITGADSVIFAYPLFAEQQVSAVIFAAWDLQWLNELISQTQLRDKTTILLVDRNGTILVHQPEPEPWMGDTFIETPLIQAILSGDAGVQTLLGLDEISRLYAFTPVGEELNSIFFVGSGISERDAFAQANQNMGRHLFGLSVVFVLTLILALIGSEITILRRVRTLLTATKRLAAGDLSPRIGHPYGKDELSQLALAFDKMTDALESREEERKKAEDYIRKHNRELAALNYVTATMSSSLELPEVLEILKRLLSESLNVPGGAIHFYDEANDILCLEVAWGIPASILSEFKRFPANSYHYEIIVRGKEPVMRTDMRQVLPFSLLGLHQSRPQWQGYLGVPLVAKGQVQGVLDIFSMTRHEFGEDQVALFCSLGQQVGVAIQNARLFDQVRAASQRLQLLSQQLLEIQEAERRHIARELHDEIGQALTAVKVNLQTALRVHPQNSLVDNLEESIDITERALQQVRNLSLDLRPSLLDDLGIKAALRWYVDRQAQLAGFEAYFHADLPDERLSPELETTCFRVVQEALTNVVRHANATKVSVRLGFGEQGLELVIQDDGIGFDVDAVFERAAGDFSLGLLGMRERVELVGGDITIISDPDKGTEIRANFPLELSYHSRENHPSRQTN
jgi:signal transduction histidine kinase